VSLLGVRHEDKGVFEVHPEHRFFAPVSEIGFRPTERVSLLGFQHTDLHS
jgi:hypothetical protein